MTASELFQAGKLSEAVEAALSEVKKQPTDVECRGRLCELLCFAGDLERADRQLDTIGMQNPEAEVGISLFRQLIRGEMARREFYDAGRLPEFVGGEVDEVLQPFLEASVFLRDGDTTQAGELLDAAEEKRSPVAGKCSGEPFDDFRDLDDLTAPCFEVLTSTGKYFWVAIERIRSIQFHPPKLRRDLLWRQATIDVADGPDGEVFIPAIYPTTATVDDEQLRLGRGTDWQGGDGSPVRGVGLRMFLVGEETKTIHELDDVVLGAD